MYLATLSGQMVVYQNIDSHETMVIALSPLRSWDHLRMNIVEVACIARWVILVMDSSGKPLRDTPVAPEIDCLILLGDWCTKVQAIHVEMDPLAINACACRGANGIGVPGIRCSCVLAAG